MIERDLRTFLLESDAIRDAANGGIWHGFSRRIRRNNRVIIRRISTNRGYHLSNEHSLPEHIIQIDCYSKNSSESREMFEKVRNRLSGYRGIAGDGYIQSVRILSERHLLESPEDGSDEWTHRYSADFALFYTELEPAWS